MKGNEGLDFTIHPQISNVYRHFRRKDEGKKGKIAFRFKTNPAIKIFLKPTHLFSKKSIIVSYFAIQKHGNHLVIN